MAGAGRGRHTGLDENGFATFGMRQFTCPKVPDSSVKQRRNAAEADAHATAGRKEHARVFTCVEESRSRLGADARATALEGDSATILLVRPDDWWAEALDLKAITEPGCRPLRLERLDEPTGPANPRVPFRPIRYQLDELGHCDLTIDPGVTLDEAEAIMLSESTQFVAEDERSRRPGTVHDDDVIEVVQVTPDHAHYRRDATPAAHKQRLPRARFREDEATGGLIQVHHQTRSSPMYEEVADPASRDRLHRDRQDSVRVWRRGYRIGSPEPNSVHIHAQSDPLPRAMAGPTRAGPEHHRYCVPGLWMDLHDSGAERGTRTKRVKEFQVVRRYQRRGNHRRQADGSTAELGDGHVSIMMTPPHERMTG